jgi:hypothetical protein
MSKSAVPVLLALAAALSASSAAEAKAAKPPGACKYVTTTDVEHVMGWHVDSIKWKKYDIAGATGSMCVLDSSQGVVTVTLPDPGSPFPGITAFNNTEPELVKTSRESGAYIAMYNSTVYVTKHGMDVSVHVIPTEHPASYAEVEPFAKIVIARIK